MGHAGTLDPFATGLLLVLVGRGHAGAAFPSWRCRRPTARLRGSAGRSTTGDPEGELVAHRARCPSALEIPTGELMQRPPAFSAVKVGGERLYKKARRGELVEARAAPGRRSTASELLGRDGERAEFEIECSSGTYVRQLVADLGDAYCEELERTAIGPFRLEDADPERILPLEARSSSCPSGSSTRTRPGCRTACRSLSDRTPEVRHADDVRLAVAIAEPRRRRAQPVVVFRREGHRLPDVERARDASRSARSTASTSGTAR